LIFQGSLSLSAQSVSFFNFNSSFWREKPDLSSRSAEKADKLSLQYESKYQIYHKKGAAEDVDRTSKPTGAVQAADGAGADAG
jgi:hypothetical protein